MNHYIFLRFSWQFVYMEQKLSWITNKINLLFQQLISVTKQSNKYSFSSTDFWVFERGKGYLIIIAVLELVLYSNFFKVFVLEVRLHDSINEE